MDGRIVLFGMEMMEMMQMERDGTGCGGGEWNGNGWGSLPAGFVEIGRKWDGRACGVLLNV
jgi:hypothetical protein